MFNSGTSARTASEVARKSRPPSRTSSGGARRRERLVLGMQGARRSSPNEPGLSRQAGSLVVLVSFSSGDLSRSLRRDRSAGQAEHPSTGPLNRCLRQDQGHAHGSQD